MRRRQVRRRRRRGVTLNKRWRGALWVGVAVLALAWIVGAATRTSPWSAAAPGAERSSDLPGESGGPAVTRAVYPWSVVPGGAYTPTELQDAMAADPVVAAHHTAVRPGALHAVRVDAPRRVYVSYRVGDAIYWTKTPVTLHPGERLLTDGVHEIRARCGNGISDRPMQPIAAAEPEAFEFDRALPPVIPGLAPATLGPRTVADVPPGAEAAVSDLVPALTSRAHAGDAGDPDALASPYEGAGLPDRWPPALGPMVTMRNPDVAQPGSLLPESGVASDEAVSGPAGSEPPVTVPEPGAVLLVGLGLAAFTLRRVRRADRVRQCVEAGLQGGRRRT